MPLTKQNLNINFSQGLDTKTDPWQVSAGKFLSLQNSIFTKGGLLSKRNGFQPLSTLPDSSSNNLCTFKDNLFAIGSDLQGLSQDTQQWFNKGSLQPAQLDVVPVVRSSSSQNSVDLVIAPNGLGCTAWVDSDTNCYYQIFDSETGQIVVSQTQLTALSKSPRVFILGYKFIITYVVGNAIKYIAISYNNPTVVSTPANITTVAVGVNAAYDGVVSNNNLYVAFAASDVGNAVRVTYLDSTLIVHVVKVLPTINAVLISLCADETGSTPNIYVIIFDANNDLKGAIYDVSLNPVITLTTLLLATVLHQVTASAAQGLATIFIEKVGTYPYNSVPTDRIQRLYFSLSGSVGALQSISLGAGIVSKSVYVSELNTIYFLAAYQSDLQPTYFLLDQDGNDIAKLAYSNGTGYTTTQVLPQLIADGTSLSCGYLIQDLLVPVNKSQGISPLATFAQSGINLVTFNLSQSGMITNDIANNLHLTGGFLWMYDGVKPVEHGFHLYPEDIGVSTAGAGGFITAQLYYYYVTYEWTDAQGNLHRSAPSIPYSLTTAGATSANTIKIPTLRQTYKRGSNLVRIVIYRWSTAQPIPYQVTSITSPLLNDVNQDFVTYVDTLADSSILGGVILYTFGGVVENIGAPACDTATLFKNRLILLDSEDKNLLWYSKQVIETTPVETSSFFTIYVAPTISAQGSTGSMKALSAMDDKLILFKKNAIYYLTGNGPDNTGNNNDFSEPTFITSTVGCSNQRSVVFMPQGLMFQSDKGIWVLGRDLQTSYIGSPVEMYNDATVLSAVNIPATNQVRFTLDNGVTLMYDYFFGQWGTFVNVPAISSTIYQSLHTYLNSYGQVFQENPGSYLDGSNPVLMSFTTSWLNLAGIQGYERSYFFFLLGKYYSPHKLNVQIAYDYNSGPTQTTMITPINYSGPYGDDPLYGSSSPYGGASNVEQWRVFLTQQKCQAFQITVSEIFDASYGVTAGAGLTLSGLNVVVGAKSSYPRLAAKTYAG